MPEEPGGTLLRYIRKLLISPAAARLPDQQLLQRFIEQREEAAFAALLHRHGPLVHGVCRRVLGLEHDAEDAFQATFLVLAQKAHAIRSKGSLGSWLYGVAYRIAARARADAARRRALESKARTAHWSPANDRTWQELCDVLDEELHRLPEKYRAPLVLCYLEGQTQDEAAQQLGWSPGKIKGLLERGRDLLRARLTRRGITLSSALLLTALIQQAGSASLPAAFQETTLHTALLATTRQLVPGLLGAQVTHLAKGAMQSMLLANLKVGAAVLLTVCVLAAGAGWLLSPEAREKQTTRLQEEWPPRVPPRVGADQYGDMLPPGAIARLGTIRLRPGSVVSSIAFSPDGKSLASGNWGPGLHLWDVATGKDLRRFTAYQDKVHSVAFAPDGRNLASAESFSHKIHLWDVATGKEIRQFIAPERGYHTVAFSPDSESLASAESNAKAIYLWDVATGQQLRQLGDHPGNVDCFAWSPGGQFLAAGGRDGTIRLWKTATGELLRVLSGHRRIVSRLAWSPDRKRLASGGSDGTVRLWDVDTGKEIRRLGVDGEERSKELRKELFATMKAPIDPVGHLGHINGLAFSRDGKSIFSASGDYRSIFQWEADTGKELRRLAGPQRVFCLDLSRDGKTLAVGGAMNSIDFWDVATGDLIHPYAGPQGRAFSVAFSPDGKLLASGGDDQVIHLWETATWQERARLRGHEFYVLHLQFSADGRTLASGSEDFTVRVWDLATGHERLQFAEKHGVAGRSIALAPNGKLLAAGATVWDLTTRTVLHRFTNPADPSGRDPLGRAAAFSPDSQILALFSPDGIRLCDPVTGRLLRRLDPASGMSSTAAFSADGKALLTDGPDKKLHLWEVATGRERRSFAGHQMPIHSVAISADGKMLASGSGSFRDHEDDSVRLWDAATGKELNRFTGHRNLVGCVAFSPDSKTVASASEDNTVLIWDVAVFAQAQPPQTSNLSAKELESLFAALASEDASKAYQAICTLAATPKQTPVFLQERLQAVPPVDPERIVQLVADLDSARFVTREKATQELERLGELAESALHKALAGKPSLEVRQRLEGLLAKLQRPVSSSEKLRVLRAIEVLEHIGTPEAQQELKTLARGAPDARLTREARASLDRLAKQNTSP